jgi:hypothetical protein
MIRTCSSQVTKKEIHRCIRCSTSMNSDTLHFIQNLLTRVAGFMTSIWPILVCISLPTMKFWYLHYVAPSYML